VLTVHKTLLANCLLNVSNILQPSFIGPSLNVGAARHCPQCVYAITQPCPPAPEENLSRELVHGSSSYLHPSPDSSGGGKDVADFMSVLYLPHGTQLITGDARRDWQCVISLSRRATIRRRQKHVTYWNLCRELVFWPSWADQASATHTDTQTVRLLTTHGRSNPLIDWVMVLRRTPHKMAHCPDVSSQSLGTLLKKLNLTQQKQTTQEQNNPS